MAIARFLILILLRLFERTSTIRITVDRVRVARLVLTSQGRNVLSPALLAVHQPLKSLGKSNSFCALIALAYTNLLLFIYACFEIGVASHDLLPSRPYYTGDWRCLPRFPSLLALYTLREIGELCPFLSHLHRGPGTLRNASGDRAPTFGFSVSYSK